MSAMLFLRNKRLEQESIRIFNVTRLAQHGDEKDVKKQFDQWELDL